MTIERIKVGTRMSQAVIHGATVYLAGQVADDPSADVADQTRQILTKVDGLLAEAGTDKPGQSFPSSESNRSPLDPSPRPTSFRRPSHRCVEPSCQRAS